MTTTSHCAIIVAKQATFTAVARTVKLDFEAIHPPPHDLALAKDLRKSKLTLLPDKVPRRSSDVRSHLPRRSSDVHSHRLAARHLTVETPEDRRVEDPLALGGETNRRNLRRQGCYRQALARPSKTNYAADRRHDLADTTNDDLVDRTRSVPSRTRDLADSTQYPADGSHDVAF